MTSADARRYFATDASIFQMAPLLVVYPRNENDVRKTARFTWELAERGRVIPMTARGSGTDQTGAALGSGIMLVFPAHLHRILELDTKANTVTVEPGINYGKLQQTLLTHNRFLPPYPSSMEYSTIGGAIANNAVGEQTVKYGDTRTYVDRLRVVLANSEVIETGRINKRELNKKLGLATFEGEIYRSLDALFEEQADLINRVQTRAARSNVGYCLQDVRHSDGSFDLTPLFVGSQGTLGIVTEAVMRTEAHNPTTTVMMATFDTMANAQQAVVDLRNAHDLPSALELIDGGLLAQVAELSPNQLSEEVSAPFPAAVLFVEYDNANERQHKKSVKKAQKLFETLASSLRTETTMEGQQKVWKVRQATSAILGHNEGLLRAVPVIEDAAVPIDQISAYFNGVYALLDRENLKPAIWGRAGDGIFHVQPKLNLGLVGDRQKAFRLMDDYYKLVISLGGTISSERNDGRLRAPYIEAQYGPEIAALFNKIKQIFDPYGTMNPGVKIGTSIDELKTMVRPDYTLDHIYDHLPRG